MSCAGACASCAGCPSAVAGPADVVAVGPVGPVAAWSQASAAADDAMRSAALDVSSVLSLRRAARDDDAARRSADFGAMLDFVSGVPRQVTRDVATGARVVGDAAAAAARGVGDVVLWPVRAAGDALSTLKTVLVVGAVALGAVLLLRSR